LNLDTNPSAATGTFAGQWLAVIAEIDDELTLFGDQFKLRLTCFGNNAAILRLTMLGMGMIGEAD
jgi:hypothetical protein